MPELGSVTAVHHLQTSLEEELGWAGPEVRTRTNGEESISYRKWLQAGVESSLWEHLFQRGSHQETHSGSH